MLFLLLNVVLFIVSVYLIMVGADWITDSSVHLARRIGTSNLAFGLIVISLLLSLPELVIAISSIAIGHAALGFGASLGSVIVNIGLIIGISAMIRPMRIPRIMVTRDMIFMTIVSIVVVALALEDRNISRGDGLVFMLLFIPYVINVYEQEKNLTTIEKREKTERMTETLKRHGDYKTISHTPRGLTYFILGLIMLLIGSEIFLRILLNTVTYMGFPEILIGITLGALGPSIPNFAAALGAARKGVEELVISETIGSNIFTLLITLGIIAILNPMDIDENTAWVSAPALLTITFTLLIIMIKGHIKRWEGMLLVLMYIATIIAEFIFRSAPGAA